MKITAILIFSAVALPVLAQKDFCKNIKEQKDKLRGWTVYSTSYKEPVILCRSIADSYDSTYITLIKNVPVCPDGAMKGGFILLEDGYAIRSSETTVNYVPLYNKCMMHINVPLTGEDVDRLKASKIQQTGVGGFTLDVSRRLADLIQGSLPCIEKK